MTYESESQKAFKQTKETYTLSLRVILHKRCPKQDVNILAHGYNSPFMTGMVILFMHVIYFVYQSCESYA